MNVSIDWNKLNTLPGDNDKCFEEFCYHIALHLFGDIGSMSYFYNTPGSEFYLTIIKPKGYAGTQYETGDVIGWQCKFWRSEHDDDNSPLGANHIHQLVNGFKISLKRQPNIKLWIICTPGSFVEDQWDKLVGLLKQEKADCLFESWHRATFQHHYLNNYSSCNGVFQYYFGEHISKLQLDEITKDTLERLKRKFDLDLHTATSFENSLMAIVDDRKVQHLLTDKIGMLASRVKEDKQRPIFNEGSWLFPRLTTTFKDAYTKDIYERYKLCDCLSTYLSDENILEKTDEIRQCIIDYSDNRRERVDVLNDELDDLFVNNHNASSLDYVVSEMISRITDLEEIVTIGHKKDTVSILDIVERLLIKDFSVFAEAGHGKTHFACSVASNMIQQEKPVVFMMGSQFRNCNGCESKLIELLQMPLGSTINDSLDILDFLGELYRCKIPIIIDGLNETAPNEKRWQDELPPFRKKIVNRKKLILITTCRDNEEYIKTIYGLNNYKETEHPVYLQGIESKNLQQTVERYFKKYNIQPNSLSAYSLFTNPLLLKVFCETNKERGTFDVNEYSLATCMKDYSERLITNIATVKGKHDRVLHNQIERALNRIALTIWEKNDRLLDFYDDFAPLFADKTEDFLNEGMCFMIDNVRGKEKIQFSYDLVAGYHIAKAIIDSNETPESFCVSINEQFGRLFGDNRNSLAEDVIKNLFYLVPLRFGKQWFELMQNSDIVLAAMEHLDIIVFDNYGKEAFVKQIVLSYNNSETKGRMCERLYNRLCYHSNYLYLSLFLPLFNGMTAKEIDIIWNSKLVGDSALSHIESLLNDKYWSDRYPLEDKIVLSILLCGIINKGFRFTFIETLFSFVNSDLKIGLSICKEGLGISDPYIIEGIVSVIVGVGLRTKDKKVLCLCISLLEDYIRLHNTNPVFLLDGLETLYSLGEQCNGLTFDRTILYKNKTEEWPVVPTDSHCLYNLFDYDYEKYHIWPLMENGGRREVVLRADELYGMLFKRVFDYGYNEDAFSEIEENVNENVYYRQNTRSTFSEKLGRSAVLELYGWLLINGRLKGEYKNTFRSDIIEIDPSFPRIKKKSLISQSFLVRDIKLLPEWIRSSNIGIMEELFIRHLPKTNNEWVLMRGFFEQRVKDKHCNVYFSGISQLIPRDMNEADVSNTRVRDELDYYHAFLGEMGWRQLEPEEDYYDNWDFPDLLSKYSFSSWNRERLQNPTVYLLNERIAKGIGLELDMNTLEYSFNGESVSNHYLNETDHFFYLRKDIVDTILKKYDAKLRYHLYERRIVDEDLSEEMSKIQERFIQNEKDMFYP